MLNLLDEVHRILGPLASDDLARLKASIERDGTLMPVVVQESTGAIIDGKHRAQVSNDYPVTKLDVDDKEAARLAVALNLARRHLSFEQKRELTKLLRDAEFTQQEVAEMVGETQQATSKREQGSNTKGCNVSLPDLRYKVTPKGRQEIAQRADGGETHSQIGADFGVSRRRVSQIVKTETKRHQKATTGIVTNNKDVRLICGDFAHIGLMLQPNSFDAIITDPPYSRSFLPLYETLAQHAYRLLKPGGVLLVMSGQSYLPEVFAMLNHHLTYHWTLTYLTLGGQSPTAPSVHKNVNSFWKPVLWFVKGKYTGPHVGDVIKSEMREKSHHIWEQSELGIARLVERFTAPGGLVLDPFLGSGTTALACHRLGRGCVGIEIDEHALSLARKRVFSDKTRDNFQA